MRNVAILIPAYKPDHRLNELIDALRHAGLERIVVIDDGSGARYAPIFNEAWLQGARVLSHEVNRGKGAALKTGLNWLNLTGTPGVVTCDCDGQHAPRDVIAVANELLVAPDALVLGTRDTREMPTKSRMGNALTRVLFAARSRLWIRDTQTGLRGLPEHALDALTRLGGERYEYEMNMLLFAGRNGIPIIQMPIATVYFDNNARTHFQPLRDGLKIYGELFRPTLGRRSGGAAP